MAKIKLLLDFWTNPVSQASSLVTPLAVWPHSEELEEHYPLANSLAPFPQTEELPNYYLPALQEQAGVN